MEIEIFSSVTLPCLATIFMALGRSRFSIIFCYMHKLCETNGCYGVRGTKSDKWLCRVNGRLLKSVSKRQNLNYFHSQSFFFPFRIFSEQTKLNLICYKLHIVERNERKKIFFFHQFVVGVCLKKEMREIILMRMVLVLSSVFGKKGCFFGWITCVVHDGVFNLKSGGALKVL